MNGSARRAAAEASPALATLTNGRPSARRPSSIGAQLGAGGGQLAGVVGRRVGSSEARAKSLAVPVAMTASGTPRRPASSAAVADGAVAAGHGDAVGVPAGDALEVLGVAAAGADLGAVAAHPVRERLGVEAPSGGRVGDQRDAHASPGYRRGGV